ncbi:putative glutamine amidotransferase [Microbacteriaceae bacterium MWH-Ta3]|nr:putative glutamine amidotransferase [Microbacteriaceae bacterium MWH-Ta3]
MSRASRKVMPSDVIPAGIADLPDDAPTVAVVVSLNFPDMTDEINDLVIRFTTTALESLTHAGARSILVDSSLDALPDPSVVHAADGVLFLGGGDVDPGLYGVTGPVPHLYGVDRAADVYSIDLINATIARDAPLFAICRGSQLLNFAQGGSLIPDLDPWALHRGGPGKPMFLDEPVSLEPGSKIRKILGRDRIAVRSGHHQAVGEVAPSLRVSARADDGIIEGTEHRTATWVVGVQWHPEDSDGSREDRDALFAAFVEQVRANQSRRRQS